MSNKNVSIIPSGSRVITKIGKVEAITTSVSVSGSLNDNISYRIAYFHNGEHKSAWVESFEIEVKEDNSKPMGFNNHSKLLS